VAAAGELRPSRNPDPVMLAIYAELIDRTNPILSRGADRARP